ncbi:MAG: NfeD family protein [Dehalococcoidia bacterium]|nr:NfeD family protein [Dehalococcoidia bacterium]
MPLFGLGLFLVLPLELAIPSYLLVLVATAWLFYKVVQAMKQPVSVGREALVGQEVEVVLIIETPSMARYLVRHGGELWSATSADEFRRGDRALIAGLEGIRIRIQSLDGGSPVPAMADSREKCH